MRGLCFVTWRFAHFSEFYKSVHSTLWEEHLDQVESILIRGISTTSSMGLTHLASGYHYHVTIQGEHDQEGNNASKDGVEQNVIHSVENEFVSANGTKI